ncbi:MAG: hypothetical protein ACO1N9_02680 [Flavobacterium sp.]
MMNMEKNKDFGELFNRFDGQWDEHEPDSGHQLRFLDRLQPEVTKKKKTYLWPVFSVAATILIMLGVFFIYNGSGNYNTSSEALASISPEARKTQFYFASVIEKELTKVENEKSPETQRIVKDALFRMQKLEKDYDDLTKQLLEDGENNQLLNAMITNLQTRVSFLQDVMTQIENTKKLKQQDNETNQL